MAQRAGQHELTVDELAAAAGMTVRNVRAYASRGLLPPPRLAGRTGYYGPDHLARLRLVRQMLAQGHTLATIERAFAGAAPEAGAAQLALYRALVAPWAAPEPEVVGVDELTARTGVAVDDELLDRLAALGVLELLDTPGDRARRVRVVDAALLATGLQVIELGMSADALVSAQLDATAHIEQAAERYVRLFRDTVWRDYLDRGAPEGEEERITAVVERLQPLAAQAVLAAFAAAMTVAVAEGVQAEGAALLAARARPSA